MHKSRSSLVLLCLAFQALGCSAGPEDDGPAPGDAGGSPLAMLRSIDALDGSVEQISALEAWAIEQNTHTIRERDCEVLQNAEVKQRCVQLAGRPHLYENNRRREDRHPAVAQVMKVVEEQLSGEGAVDPEVCAGIEASATKAECNFQIGDLVARSGRLDQLPVAMDFCGLAGNWASDCFLHTAQGLADAGEAPDLGSPTSWDASMEAAATFAALIGEHRSNQEAALVSQYWARLALRSVQASASLSTAVLPSLPRAGQTQLRAALAWRLVESAAPGAGLAELEAALQGLIDQGGELPQALRTSSHEQDQDIYKPFDLFECIEGAEPQGYTRVEFLHGGPRLYASDVAEDQAICLLEAWARMLPEQLEIFEEAKQRSEPGVAATALRLSSFLADPATSQGVSPQHGCGGEAPPENPPEGGLEERAGR